MNPLHHLRIFCVCNVSLKELHRELHIYAGEFAFEAIALC